MSVPTFWSGMRGSEMQWAEKGVTLSLYYIGLLILAVTSDFWGQANKYKDSYYTYNYIYNKAINYSYTQYSVHSY